MQLSELWKAYSGKRVLVTGHTGFKGAWLCEWLSSLGAEVVGIALEPDQSPSLFEELGLAARLEHHIHDIRDRSGLRDNIVASRPDYLFHLAAQPLVRTSYSEPVETYETNVMGTIHVLDALRAYEEETSGICSAIFVTTDKCYENREWNHAYREGDALGGYDPYSSSKAAAELAIASYRRSFFNPATSRARRVAISSVRAGNVIGGGDWALDRIVPDCIRSLQSGDPIQVRNPVATRPWQHVLEPLGGYLCLAAEARAAQESADQPALETLCSAFNFGPTISSNRSVAALVEEVTKHWPGSWHSPEVAGTPHEAGKLNLAWEKAFHNLGWHPRWDFAETIRRTTDWYKARFERDADARELVAVDIRAYVAGD